MRYILFCLLFSSWPAQGNELDHLLTILNNTLADTKRHQAALQQGKERGLVCKYCHGQDGNSKRNYIPNLAQQNPQYLLHQFELFASKVRKDRIMSELAANLSAEDRVNIALYYTSQTVKPQADYRPELRAKGETLYNETCASCHGVNGYGKQTLPRIASQPAKYLNKTLMAYRSGSVQRPKSPMQYVASRLDNTDIDALISYITAMK